MFIKKIFQNKVDESVHKYFVRFGKGTYGMKAVMNVRKQKDKIKISTTFEYANDFVEFISSITDSVKVSGIILSRNEIQGLEGKKKKGLFNYEIDKELKKDELKNIIDSCYFALLDCSAQGIELKVKKKIPRPGGKGGEKKVNDKFCVMMLDMKFLGQIHSEFLFDLPTDFKKVRIEHTYEINEIVVPDELKKSKDFDMIRKEAKRKGQIIRKIIVDKKETIIKNPFIV
jgi:hypothetical protein